MSVPGVAGAEPQPARGGAVDYVGRVRIEYRPKPDRDADPGEIVWSWVAFEDDPTIGKDRPIVLLGRTTDGRFAAVMMSSRDRRGSRGWVPIGSGAWDPQRRASWVRIDRLLAVPSGAIRREGATLDPATFERIVRDLVAHGVPVSRRRPLLTRLLARLRGRAAR